MPSRRIESLIPNEVSDRQLRNYFLTQHGDSIPDDLITLFEVALENKALFPNINMPDGEDWQNYIDRWTISYLRAHRNPPSSRIATPKSSCNDPAIREIVRIATGISEEVALEMESCHSLFMSAENCQGGLLEEYIDSAISRFGWIWCKGNSLRSIDFCLHDGSYLLQVKNKSNTENSSSSAIRVGTNIEKWYRLGTTRAGGRCFPFYRWHSLNNIIRQRTGRQADLSEEGYIAYIRHAVSMNSEIISDE